MSVKNVVPNLLVKHISSENKKMVAYKCFNCGRDVKSEYVKKKVRCPYCGGKILNKQRTKTTIIKAV